MANVAVGLDNLALDQITLGQLDSARSNVHRSIQLCRQLKDERQEAVGHQILGSLLAYFGRFDEAAQEFDMALGVFTLLHELPCQLVTWSDRTLMALLMKNNAVALETAGEATRLARSMARAEYPQERNAFLSEWLLGWALTEKCVEDVKRHDQYLSKAETHISTALNRCRNSNATNDEPDILLTYARWYRTNGCVEDAQRDAREALSVADRCEYRLKQADVHNFLS